MVLDIQVILSLMQEFQHLFLKKDSTSFQKWLYSNSLKKKEVSTLESKLPVPPYSCVHIDDLCRLTSFT